MRDITPLVEIAVATTSIIWFRSINQLGLTLISMSKLDILIECSMWQVKLNVKLIKAFYSVVLLDLVKSMNTVNEYQLLKLINLCSSNN